MAVATFERRHRCRLSRPCQLRSPHPGHGGLSPGQSSGPHHVGSVRPDLSERRQDQDRAGGEPDAMTPLELLLEDLEADLRAWNHLPLYEFSWFLRGLKRGLTEDEIAGICEQ